MNKYETINNMKFQQNYFFNKSPANYRNNNDYRIEFNNTFNNFETNLNEQHNNTNMNYYELKNIIRNEFAELILPYQKQLNNYDILVEKKINKVESNLKSIIDSKSFDNINQTAQMINLFMKNPNNSNKNQNQQQPNNIEKNNNDLVNQLNLMLKKQYDDKFDVLERHINSNNSLLNTFKKTFDSNMLDIFKNNEIKKSYLEKSEYERYKNEIDLEFNKIKEEGKNNKLIGEQIEKLYEKINDLILENNNNKMNSLNEINTLKKNYSGIEKIINELRNKINTIQIDKIKELNIDSLKDVNIYEINELKENLKITNDNVDDLYEKAKNNDKHFKIMSDKFNELEQNLNYINKDVDFLNKQNLNEKLAEFQNKFEELNNKLDEYHLRNKSITNKMENIDKIIHEEDNKNEKNIYENNDIENKKGETENLFGLTGSRRQRRNLTKSEIHYSKNKNSDLNLDENSIKILKQFENFNPDIINKKLESLSSENKIILSKIETNNDHFMNLNEQENKLNEKLEELNKKIKESENRLYLLELKNFGNVYDNNNNNKEIKENGPPFLTSDNNNNKVEDSKNYEKNKINVGINMNNIYGNDNINLNKNNEDELMEKIMKEENNNFKERGSFGLKDEEKSKDNSSISNLIKPILDYDRNSKSKINNSKLKEEQTNNKINDTDNYDDFDDI